MLSTVGLMNNFISSIMTLDYDSLVNIEEQNNQNCLVIKLDNDCISDFVDSYIFTNMKNNVVKYLFADEFFYIFLKCQSDSKEKGNLINTLQKQHIDFKEMRTLIHNSC